MSHEEELIHKGRLVEDFVTARSKLFMLQESGKQEAKVLEVIVNFLRTGGHEQIALGMPPEAYLSEKLGKLVNDLNNAHEEKNRLQEALSRLGLTVE